MESFWPLFNQYLPALVVGALTGSVISYLFFRRAASLSSSAQQAICDAQLQQLQQQLDHSDDVIDKLHVDCDSYKQQAASLNEDKLNLVAKVSELSATQQQLITAHEQQLTLIKANEEALKNQFSHLAQQTLEKKSEDFAKANQRNIDAILAPLKAQLGDFKQQVQHSHDAETKQRHELKHEIHSLKQLNQQMAQDAINLTKALKGDNKQQGNWGEVILERILQESGLRDGHEYQTQGQHRNEDGKAYRPDVIVHLPDNKDIIIDSKVSLTGYERYFNTDDELAQQVALKEHIQSLRSHIKELGQKDYHQLKGLRSLDYVLLFIPIEPAFLLAIEHEPNLISYALDNNIMLVSPTNLLVALRTIHNLWRIDQQNKNAQLIAHKASKLYDKIRLFGDDLLSVSAHINKANHSVESAIKKLTTGKGNIIGQVQGFEQLGVEVKKPINSQLTEHADEQLEQDLSLPTKND
ncbi:DNA recombination protein RmuC [Psychrobium sp. MM17-31]|uniref:DNA recombination protein RmuC n=1 Tax=Psychrobium sp. MM17-31 TaxID=2917758 RepID=UPI001EF5814D|nr:DNA recombination protein RmuC [Psychrobium sp. MM17-31]MCG7532518.1 DNA recombination protein RmuC [Psychrobium sp. MM17-31]